MAWNEPGNGQDKGPDKGRGDRNDPWKSGGNQQPPDLDEIFRNMSGSIRKLFGGSKDGRYNKSGSGSSRGGIGLLVLLALAIWIVFTSFYIVDEQERGVVLRFGKHVKTMQPGFNITLPRPIDEVTKVNVTKLFNEKTVGQMLTVDENIVDVSLDVQYKIKDPEDYLFFDQQPDNSLIQVAESAMRQVVGDSTLDYALLDGRAENSAKIKVIIQDTLDRYKSGLIVNTINMEDVKQPQEVKAAFDDAIKAREDKERSQREATAYANQKIPESRGTAARKLQDAEAYKQSLIAQATGESERFKLLLEEYQIAPEVTRQRLYLETMESVLGNTPKILLDANQGNLMLLPLDKLMNSQPGTGVRLPETSSNIRDMPSFTTTPSMSSEYNQREDSRRTARNGR